MEKILQAIKDAKLIIGTIALIITSLIGSYQVATEYFVTKAYAEDFERNAQQQIHQLKKLTQQNTTMMLEFQALKYEDKLTAGGTLTATQKRHYDLVKKQLEELNKIEQVPATPAPIAPAGQ